MAYIGSKENKRYRRTIDLEVQVDEALRQAAHERRVSIRYIVDAALRRYLKVKP